MGKTILMLTHDPAVSRAADRVLRIQDGVIMRDATPVGVGVEALASCADMLRGRRDEFDAQRTRLEAEFKEGGMTGDILCGEADGEVRLVRLG